MSVHKGASHDPVLEPYAVRTAAVARAAMRRRVLWAPN